MAENETDDLLRAYLERREALVRYFSLRTGSADRAEDLVQEIYLKITSLEPDALKAVRNAPAFLYRLGSNLMLDRLKQERRSRARDAEWRRGEAVETAAGDAADITPADQAVAARQRLEQVLAAVNELSPQARRAFRLHKLEGRSHAETAAAMGVSKSAVEKHISAVLKHLMKRLE